MVVERWATPKKQHPDVKCKYCLKVICHGQPKKNLRPHLRRCPKIPDEIRTLYPISPSKRKRDRSEEVNTPSKRARIGSRSTGPDGLGPISLTEKKEFHLEVARAFFTSGIPFRVIENREIRCILTKYRPGMILPTRQELSPTLLYSIYAEEVTNVVEVLREQEYVVIVCDGWSDPNSESIINFMVTSPYIRPLFWSSTRSCDEQHTGMYMSSQLAIVIREVEDIVGKGSVCGVVTDNASNMRKSWELLVDKIPSLTCNGCAAHTINLLLKDMFGITFMDDVLKKSIAVTKFVRKRPALLLKFRAKQHAHFGPQVPRRALVIPVATSWYSSTNCIARIVRNEEVLREIFCDGILLARYGDAVIKLNRIQAILANGAFWMNARTVLRLVNPVIKALGALEKDGCCLSMVYHYFGLLTNNDIYTRESDDVQSGVLTTIRGQIRSRWNTLKRESILAAFLLDPSKSIEAFEGNDLERAVDGCVELASRVGLPSSVNPDVFRKTGLAFVRMKNSWSTDEREKIRRIRHLIGGCLKVGDFRFFNLSQRVC